MAPSTLPPFSPLPEDRRLQEAASRERNWKRWGPYLSERQWATVREDYSPYGSCWDYFPHDHARSRAYRWGEDGLLGICDREGRLCFAVALWNGKDPILKERLFGLTGPEGNHGEDAKECWFYLDSTPTHSYMRALYKYPQAAFPYGQLVDENRRRGRMQPEYELEDTGIFDESRYFDVFAEYAKASPDDVLIRLTVANRGPDAAALDLLPTLWFRNTWSWGRDGEGYWPKPSIRHETTATVVATHASLGVFRLAADGGPEWLFTDNETNVQRLYGAPNPSPWVKDAFDQYVVHGRHDAVNPDGVGTKVAARWHLTLAPGEERVVRLRLTAEQEAHAKPFDDFAAVFDARRREADELHAARMPAGATPDEAAVIRQANAGLLWSKQFYHFIVRDWLEGDPAQPTPPASRQGGRNHDWRHLYNRDVISMPDKWEYPWYAAWDLAFHMIPLARLDPALTKRQLMLFLREWYMAPNGQLPAYEFAFGDVNPPVHAWAVWRVYKMTAERGRRDRAFLASCFQKLCLNFTWWVNRKDVEGNNIFGGGFLGLDNIGVFDRSKPLPTGGVLEQADGTAWMAFFCATMLSIALELAAEDPVYEDMASKFFEHFIAIAEAMNTHGGSGLWDEEDGFYYDHLRAGGTTTPMRVRSIVGVIPLFACEVLEDAVVDRLPGFKKRTRWFLEHRKDVTSSIACMHQRGSDARRTLLAITRRDRLERVLQYVLDEAELLSPYGVRSLSRIHADHPYVFRRDGAAWDVRYVAGESETGIFGGNSNWRGPIWFPVNFLLIEALERYHHFYGDELQVECPVGSGRKMNLQEVARELQRRLASTFLPDANGRRPALGDDPRFASDPHWRELVLFHEYFNGDTGRGLGANHQTGWTALVVGCLRDVAEARAGEASPAAAPAATPVDTTPADGTAGAPAASTPRRRRTTTRSSGPSPKNRTS